MQMPSVFLNIPLAEAFKGFFVVAPSVFTFIQDANGGDQITSLIVGALGGLIVTLQALRMLNSCISPLADFFSVVSHHRSLSNYEIDSRFPMQKLIMESNIISSKPNDVKDINNASFNH